MIVKCIAKKLSKEQEDLLRAKKDIDSSGRLTIGKCYVVLGLTYINSEHIGNMVVVYLMDDPKTLTSFPLCLFEIVDDRLSKYWTVRDDFPHLDLWPEEFHEPYFHDLLSDDVEEVVEKFNKLVIKMHDEFAPEPTEPEDPHPWPFEEYK